MTEYFKKGDIVHLTNGETVVVSEKLGEGGQGVVYKVTYNDKAYALKWYHKGILKNSKTFYENLKSNVLEGAPTKHFIWPLYVSTVSDDSFGYVMELRPTGYYEFSEFLLAKVHFPSLSAVVNAALNITNGFRELHRKGYSYQDLNDGNFFINPDSGDVLICDNDNVAPEGESLGIAGKARYMAPEVVRNISRPDKYSDRFSLAVVLFRLLFLDHPLEGRIVACQPCLTEALELKYYGKSPVFIFDPGDDSNRPVPSIHRNVLQLWCIYPQFIKDLFIRAFSRDAMNADDMMAVKRTRLLDNDWQYAFVQLRDSIVKCSCGEETFINTMSDSKCINCGRLIPRLPLLVCPNKKYVLSLFPGRKIYGCHCEDRNDDFITVCGEVTRNPKDPSIWGIRNLTSCTWGLMLKDGSTKQLPPNSNFTISKISEIDFGNASTGKILLNGGDNK